MKEVWAVWPIPYKICQFTLTGCSFLQKNNSQFKFSITVTDFYFSLHPDGGWLHSYPLLPHRIYIEPFFLIHLATNSFPFFSPYFDKLHNHIWHKNLKYIRATTIKPKSYFLPTKNACYFNGSSRKCISPYFMHFRGNKS